MPFDFKPEPEYDGTLALQYSINGDSPSAASPEARIAANRLVGTYQTNIYGFINNQRLLAKTSGYGYSSRYMNLPGLEVGHRRNGKHETVSINAKPGEAYAQVTQPITNHDGYIMVVYVTAGLKADFDFQLNGTTIDHYTFQDSNGVNQDFNMRIYAFGRTALLCESVNDKQNQLLGNSGKGLRCSPPRPKVGTKSLFGTSRIGEHADAFGYFCFNFADKSNPIYFVSDDPNFPSAWDQSDFARLGGKPTLEKIKWWPNVAKSPVDITTGVNHCEIDKNSTDWGFTMTATFTAAEFYSGTTGDQRSNLKSDFRIVDSAWQNAGVKASLGGVGGATVNYRVNDKPVSNIAANLEYTHTHPNVIGVAFDLGAKTNHTMDDWTDDQAGKDLADHSEFIIGLSYGGGPSNESGGTPGGNDGMQEFQDWGSFKQALKGG